MSSPTANWQVTNIDGVDYLVITTAQFRVPLDWDPSSNMFIAVAAPNGAVPIATGGFPALIQGAPGAVPTISDTINFTGLAYDDSTADSASWTEVGTNEYELNLTLHDGAPGPAGGTSILGASDVSGTPGPGQMVVVNPAANGITFAAPPVGDRYVPASIASCPAGNPTYTLCSVPIPAQLFDWRPHVTGQCVVTATGLDLTVDLIARLSNTNTDGGETTGNQVGLAIGLPAGSWLTGPTPTNQVLASGPPAGSPDSWDRVPAGQPATIFFRIERQTGSDTFTTTAATTSFCVRVQPCPTNLAAVVPVPTGSLPGPLVVAITAPGAFSLSAGVGSWPSWATIVDVIVLGDGGGGGGAAGGGHAGGGSTCTIGEATLSAAGGAAAAGGVTSEANAAGASPGVYSYLKNTYTGGAAAAAATAANAPGGGGGGAFASGLYGWGGGAGQWVAQTYTLSGIDTITGSIGAGGAALGSGSTSEPGAAGGVWLNFRSY
jgi:hypothetical protein